MMTSVMNHRYARSALLLVFGATLLTLIASPALAQQLADERWIEDAYGLSLLPPRTATIVDSPGGDALAKFIDGSDYTITLKVLKNENPTDLTAVKERGIAQLAFSAPSAVTLEDGEVTVAGLTGFKLIYRIPERDQSDWILGQAVLQLDPSIYILLELNATLGSYEQVAGPTFTAVLESLQLTNPMELNLQRQEWLDAGEQWRKTLDANDWQNALKPEQWFRILHDGRDVGYLRVQQSLGSALKEPGIQIIEQQRLLDTTNAVDSRSDFFESVDGSTEIWSIRTTRRSRKPKVGLPHQGREEPSISWLETGVRSNGRITVSQETPTRINELKWQMPPLGYVSLAKSHLMYSLLPRDREQTLAFYVYYPAAKTLALRIMHITPMNRGGYEVREQPTPKHPEIVSLYDSQGQLIERRFANGRVLLPTTAQQVQAIWNAK